MFNFSNTATAGAGTTTSLFGSTNNNGSYSLFGGAGTFKFTAATTGGESQSVFSTGSLFGGASIFGGAAPGSSSLFGSGAASGGPSLLFNNQNSLFSFAQKKEDNDEDESGDEAPLEADNEPPAFNSDHVLIPGVTDKPIKLNIKSQPPQKSAYTKIYSVSN